MIAFVAFTWFVERSAGIVAWGLIVASMTWGLLVATRALGRKPSPAWMLAMHRWLGALAVTFTAVHVVAIVLDSFVSFRIVDALVPFASAYKTLPVAFGVIGMYLLLAVYLTSLARARLSPKTWRSIHVLSYGLFAVTTVHGLSAGTDTRTLLSSGLAFVLGAIAVFVGAMMWWKRSAPRPTPIAVNA
jgi:DMSO/TMAO reductase YedYZ heme-binding membrane subunit